MTELTSRRRLLALGGTALATTLAGCGGDGGDGGAGGGDGDDGGDATPTATSTPTSGSDGGGTQEITVGPGGDLVFDPAEVTVPAGTTVEWIWESSFHTVTPQSQPEDADWSGTGTETHDEGYTHSHAFDVAGTYEYYCDPHRGQGMVGTLTVE